MSNRLTETQMFLARHLQRKGFTLTEIAAQLDTDRERVVRTLYWDLALPHKVAA